MADDPQQPPAPLAEISHGPSRFELFLDTHQKSLLVALILLILGVAGFVVYRGIKEGTEVTAGNALYQANDAAALQKVVSEFPETPAAATAKMLLAEKQWDDNQKDASIATLQAFLAESPKHPGIPAAKATLAAKFMSLGKAADAAAAFEELVEDPASAHLAPYALLCLGDMALAGGDKEKAKNYYERAQTGFPNSNFMQSINARTASLNAAPPVEIDPPPTPEPPPASSTAPPMPVPFGPGTTTREITIPSVPPSTSNTTPEIPAGPLSPGTSDDQP